MMYLYPVPDRTLLRIARDGVVSFLHTSATVINQVIRRNAVAQLLAGVGEQRVVDGKLPTVLHPFNTLGYRGVCGAFVGGGYLSNLTPSQFAFQFVGAEIENGAD